MLEICLIFITPYVLLVASMFLRAKGKDIASLFVLVLALGFMVFILTGH